MAIKIDEIKATNWQFSTLALGEVSQGIDDIRQSIGLILTTTKGSDPFRPLFGSDIWQYMDTQVTTAVANISKEIIDSLSKWEPRIIVKKLNYEIIKTKIDFVLTFELLESGETTHILFYIDKKTQITPPAMGRAFSNGFDLGFS